MTTYEVNSCALVLALRRRAEERAQAARRRAEELAAARRSVVYRVLVQTFGLGEGR